MQIILSHGIAAILIWPLAFTLPIRARCQRCKFSMVISILSMWIFRIGFGYLLAKYLGMGVMGVWIAMYIDWAVRAFALFFDTEAPAGTNFYYKKKSRC